MISFSFSGEAREGLEDDRLRVMSVDTTELSFFTALLLAEMILLTGALLDLLANDLDSGLVLVTVVDGLVLLTEVMLFNVGFSFAGSSFLAFSAVETGTAELEL